MKFGAEVITHSGRQEGGRRFLSPSSEKTPLVSIIIVVFRAKHELQSLLESIFAIASPEVEVIVIDGGSDDETINLLREWSDRIEYWLSEPDTGIYNAMNKGLTAATGDYILHLNAGDKLRRIPVDDLRRSLADGIDVVSCQVLIDDSITFSPRSELRLRIENAWHHQGTLYRRLAHPSYNENYRVFGDFDLNQRLVKSGKTVRLLETVVADHQNDGVSVSGRHQHSAEMWRCVRANSGALYVPLAFAWYHLYPLRKVISSFRRHITSLASIKS
jgi:glycosyltransferase involved in cell wall biosynthesis